MHAGRLPPQCLTVFQRPLTQLPHGLLVVKIVHLAAVSSGIRNATEGVPYSDLVKATLNPVAARRTSW